MSTTQNQTQESFRDHIATIESDGRRHWIYPKKPKGKFYQWRTYLSWGLLLFLFAGPFIMIDGEPLLMINIFERKFVILGQIFWPQDFYLFVIAMLMLILFIILFTVVYGRLFCGWVCPQTIFMEMVFRKIEYWIEGDYKKQEKLDKMPWTAEKIRKKVLKNGIFILISVLIAHTFLAYIIGIDRTGEIITSPPTENTGGFAAMIIFSGLFYGVFARFREQVCIIACPYGRLQGVLLDNKSIVVAYDFKRGEPRESFRKNEDRRDLGKGDCVDCGLCVDVCPTGIDIRNGTQLECINCTACIDACDSVMDRVGLPRGLVRYASEDEIKKGSKFKFTGRMVAYTAVLGILVSAFLVLLTVRSPIDATVLRSQGTLFQELDNGKIQNLYTYKVMNKTNNDINVQFKLEDTNAELKMIGNVPTIPKGESMEGALMIIMDKAELDGYKTDVKVSIFDGEERLESVETTFIGPM